AGIGLIVINALILAIVDRLDLPPRTEVATFFYLSNVLGHLGLGLLLTIPLLMAVRALARALDQASAAEKAAAWTTVASVVVCLATGIYLLVFGNRRPQRPILDAHGIATVAGLGAFTLYILFRGRRTAESQGERAPQRAARPMAGARAMVALVFVSSLFALRSPAETIRDAGLPPDSMDGEGGGRGGVFCASSDAMRRGPL